MGFEVPFEADFVAFSKSTSFVHLHVSKVDSNVVSARLTTCGEGARRDLVQQLELVGTVDGRAAAVYAELGVDAPVRSHRVRRHHELMAVSGPSRPVAHSRRTSSSGRDDAERVQPCRRATTGLRPASSAGRSRLRWHRRNGRHRGVHGLDGFLPCTNVLRAWFATFGPERIAEPGQTHPDRHRCERFERRRKQRTCNRRHRPKPAQTPPRSATGCRRGA